jgi:hypothetical protein
LVSPFSEEEIWAALFHMEHNKALGPDGFFAECFQVFWSIIKDDLVSLFQDFHRGDLPLYSLNFGTIILLPKSKDAETIQQFRPFCLLNVSFKIFTNVITNRISSVASKIISLT